MVLVALGGCVCANLFALPLLGVVAGLAIDGHGQIGFGRNCCSNGAATGAATVAATVQQT